MSLSIRTVKEAIELNLEQIEIEEFWNTSQEKEKKIHKMHAYPAKFPAFITTKALEFANELGTNPKLVADVFCGCGTVAFESKRNGIDFWGCDINPVATMIARTKSQTYKISTVKKYYYETKRRFTEINNPENPYKSANERLKYWYFEEQYSDLAILKQAIKDSIPAKSRYRELFFCVFSNILKPTSKWLTKSIKPQIDPNKNPEVVELAFDKQIKFLISALEEVNIDNNAKTKILNHNFLDHRIKRPKVDMIITSPPYVTSYEYADLHQLSSIWLDYTSDYRELRQGSVGSLYHVNNLKFKKLNNTAKEIVEALQEKDKRQASAVAKYFLDMQKTAEKCYEMMNKGGIAVFVIGDTEYKRIRIENSRHLSESLLQSGMEEVIITKRKISGKILTPYRDEQGKFSMNQEDRKVYSEEFIVIGRK